MSTDNTSIALFFSLYIQRHARVTLLHISAPSAELYSTGIILCIHFQ